MNNYFMGLDVSKGYVDITIVDENGNIAGTLNRLFDDYTGHKLLRGRNFFINHWRHWKHGKNMQI